MRKNKLGKLLLVALSVVSLTFTGAGWGDGNGGYGNGGNGGGFNGEWGGYNGEWGGYNGYQQGNKDENEISESTEVTEQDEKTSGLTINTEASNPILYLDALTQSSTKQQVFTTAKKGNYVATASLAATVEYPVTEEITVTFPYGTIYLMGTNEQDTPYRQAGDVIAYITVDIDEIELQRYEQMVERMEERDSKFGYYTYLKNMVDGMKEAKTQTTIVMEEDGYLVAHDTGWRGTQITQYSYTVADLSERMLSVTNQNNQFRYGQKVTVTGTIDNKQVTGTGTVISASSRVLSSELAGSKAYIKLDADSEKLYDARSLKVSVETIRMDNILLLDAGCVFMNNGVQMVRIKGEGGLYSSGFAFGRKSSTQYWIVDGVQEGNEVLLQ